MTANLRVCARVCVAALLSCASLMAPAQAQEHVRKDPPAAGKPDGQGELLAAVAQLKQMVTEQSRQIAEQQAALRRQEERLRSLEQQLQQQAGQVSSAAEAAAAAQQKTEDVALLEGQLEAVADSQKELGERVAKLATDTAAANTANTGRFRQLGNFRFSGDLRFRYEPFAQSQQTTRQRVRFRARLNLQGNVTEEIFGGISLATGSLDDPISTNQTLTGFFNRKQVGFDRYFIQYTPRWARGHAQFGAGKFAYPWIRTALTFDSDLHPEGIYARLNWDSKNNVFQGVSVVTMHLPFFERGGSTSASTGIRADGYDAFISGGQVQTRWKLGDRVNLGLHVAGINFVNADFIAQAHSTSAPTAGLAGTLTGNSPITNCVRTNASGQTVGYCSRFLYLNTILTVGVNTGRARWPVNFTFDFNNNTRAQRIIQNGTAAPTGTAHNRERSAYWAEIQFGRLSEVKDIQFGYTFMRIERDALITAFNESDLRAGSNVAQHRLNFNYQWTANVSLNYALWLGRLVNAQDNIGLVPGGKRVPGSPCATTPFTGCTDNTLKRQQFDFIYRF
jgi:hypothetical protein